MWDQRDGSLCSFGLIFLLAKTITSLLFRRAVQNARQFWSALLTHARAQRTLGDTTTTSVLCQGEIHAAHRRRG